MPPATSPGDRISRRPFPPPPLDALSINIFEFPILQYRFLNPIHLLLCTGSQTLELLSDSPTQTDISSESYRCSGSGISASYTARMDSIHWLYSFTSVACSVVTSIPENHNSYSYHPRAPVSENLTGREVHLGSLVTPTNKSLKLRFLIRGSREENSKSGMTHGRTRTGLDMTCHCVRAPGPEGEQPNDLNRSRNTRLSTLLFHVCAKLCLFANEVTTDQAIPRVNTCPLTKCLPSSNPN